MSSNETADTTQATETSHAPDTEAIGSPEVAAEDAAFYEAAKAVAKEAKNAFKAEHPDPDPGAEPDGAPTEGLAAEVAAKAEAKPAGDVDMPRLTKLLRAREQAQGEREKADAYRTTVERDANASAQRILREAEERGRELLREAESRARAKLEELTDPESLIARRADANDPVVQLRRELQAERAEREKLAAEQKSWRDEQTKREQERARAEHAQKQTAAEKEFVAQASEEKYPHLTARYTEKEILRAAHETIAEARAAAERKGEPFACTDGELLDHLESEAREFYDTRRDRFAKLGQQVALATKGTAARAAVTPPEVNGQRPRTSTLSARGASERRSSPKPPSQMSEDELHRAMIRAAREAKNASG